MRLIRAVGNILLWMLAALGVLSAGVWVANTFGWVQPLVVVSGSMEPGIHTGDLLVSVPEPVEELAVGDVASIASARSGNLVTHRVIEIVENGSQYEIRMKGDANDIFDSEVYLVPADETVLTPWFRVEGGGYFVTQIVKPGVALPLLIAIAALIALTAIGPARPAVDEDDVEMADATSGRAS